MTDWNAIDQDSRLSVCSILSSSATGRFTNISDSHGNCVWDISCLVDGNKTMSVEVKDRSFESTRYGDIFAEDVKQEYTKKNYKFDISLAVNVFTDGVVAFANLYDKRAKHFEKWCPRTTLVEEDDHQYIKKQCLSLPQTLRLKNINGKWVKA